MRALKRRVMICFWKNWWKSSLFLLEYHRGMKTTKKAWLLKAECTREGFEKILKKAKWTLVSLLSFIGILALVLFIWSPFLRNSLSEIILSNVLYFEYGSHENLIEKVWNIDLKNLQTLEYDKVITLPQGKINQLALTFLSPVDGNHDLEIMALSGKIALGYLSYTPEYQWLLNRFPYTEQAFKLFWKEKGKMSPCLLIKKGKSGFSNWISPEQNPNHCEVVWINNDAYHTKEIFSLTSFSKGEAKVKFIKHQLHN